MLVRQLVSDVLNVLIQRSQRRRTEKSGSQTLNSKTHLVNNLYHQIALVDGVACDTNIHHYSSRCFHSTDVLTLVHNHTFDVARDRSRNSGLHLHGAHDYREKKCQSEPTCVRGSYDTM